MSDREASAAGGLRRAMLSVRPADRWALRGWLRAVLGIDVPVGGRCEGHGGPLDYLDHVFFERDGDVAVWANRGGGKTFYGAVATLLDLLFKPGIEVRILGGSLEQSRKMYEHLRWMLDRPGLREEVSGRVTERGVTLRSGSRVEVLAQSERSVRGHRVQKLRCDEVELFDRDVWEAAQFVTRSGEAGGRRVRGGVEVFSTLHRPYGLMSELVERAWREGGMRVIRWCALDVMGRCGAGHSCDGCRLWDVCGGRAKDWSGFVGVGDVIDQARRVSAGSFECEMLCRRPSRSDAVFGSFDPAVHVRPLGAEGGLMWVGGMDFGLRNPFVMLWAQVRVLASGVRRVEVIDEYIVRERTVGEHLGAIGGRGWPMPAWIGVDPAGGARSSQTGKSTIGLLREAGYRVLARRSVVAEGLEMLRRRLEGGWCGGEGEIGLMIHPRCERLIESLTCYHFDASRPWSSEPVKDGHDHAVDALRYLVVNLERGAGDVVVRSY